MIYLPVMNKLRSRLGNSTFTTELTLVRLFIYLLSTKVDLSFAVHTENPGKVQVEVLVHILRYIRDNNTLGLKYYANMKDAPVSDLLRQVSIKIENHLMDFLILVEKIVQKLAEVQDHTLYFMKVGQLTMAYMFQDQLMNQVQKVSTMQHALQEWI